MKKGQPLGTGSVHQLAWAQEQAVGDSGSGCSLLNDTEKRRELEKERARYMPACTSDVYIVTHT